MKQAHELAEAAAEAAQRAGRLDLDDMTKGELLALGAEMDLDLKSGMRKKEIVTTIRRSRS